LRICQRCCAKFYIKKLKEEFIKDHEAKVITLKQFEDSYTKFMSEQQKVINQISEKKAEIEAKQTDTKNKIKIVQAPTLKLKQELELEQKNYQDLIDKNKQIEEEYVSKQAEKKNLKEKATELKNKYKEYENKRAALLNDMKFLKSCIDDNEKKIKEIENKKQENSKKKEEEAGSLRASFLEVERKIENEKKERREKKKAEAELKKSILAAEAEAHAQPVVEGWDNKNEKADQNLPMVAPENKESVLTIQGDSEVVENSGKNTESEDTDKPKGKKKGKKKKMEEEGKCCLVL